MASSILRMFSACVVFAVGELDLVELGHAFNDVRDLLAEAFARCRPVVTSVSSTASWSRPAAMAVASIFSSAKTCATSSGWIT